jgi:hypothetical protein
MMLPLSDLKFIDIVTRIRVCTRPACPPGAVRRKYTRKQTWPGRAHVLVLTEVLARVHARIRQGGSGVQATGSVRVGARGVETTGRT